MAISQNNFMQLGAARPQSSAESPEMERARFQAGFNHPTYQPDPVKLQAQGDGNQGFIPLPAVIQQPYRTQSNNSWVGGSNQQNPMGGMEPAGMGGFGQINPYPQSSAESPEMERTRMQVGFNHRTYQPDPVKLQAQGDGNQNPYSANISTKYSNLPINYNLDTLFSTDVRPNGAQSNNSWAGGQNQQTPNMGMQTGAQNPSYQAQNTGTTDAQVATQPTMNAGTGQFDNRFLSGLYQTQLGRMPDQEGYDFWNAALKNGVSPESIINSFQTSPEYTQLQALKSVTANPNGNPWGLSGANATGNQASTNPYIQAAQQTALGNYQGAQTATAANRVNQQTPYASLQYQQTGTDANGNPIWSANQQLNPQLQAALGGLQSQLASKAGQGIDTSKLAQTGINPGEMYSDAIMRRLQPQLQQQQASVETRLANQGIMPGSEAYNRAKQQLAQQQNDALTSAQVGGIGVGLQANQQGFNQALQQSNLPIQQLGAFNQATQPGYVNPYNQAAVSGPDYTGAYTTSQAAAIAAQNAANARTANLQSGLFGLGSSAVLGAGGVGNLLSGGLNALGSGYNWLSGLGGSNYSGPSYGVNPNFSNDVFDYLSFD
jgi:hypothetical protein